MSEFPGTVSGNRGLLTATWPGYGSDRGHFILEVTVIVILNHKMAAAATLWFKLGAAILWFTVTRRWVSRIGRSWLLPFCSAFRSGQDFFGSGVATWTTDRVETQEEAEDRGKRRREG
jgi:hypothetical protein